MAHVYVTPGPINGDLLFLQEQHRARYLFVNGDPTDGSMSTRRGDKNFWDCYRAQGLTPRVKNIIIDVGLLGLLECETRNYDVGLLQAFVERWRPETNTFHLPIGEATVTLQDVNILFGIQIEGDVLCGTETRYTKQDQLIRCETLLGVTAEPTEILGQRIRTTALFRELEKQFVETDDEVKIEQRARLVIFILCAVVLFPNSNNNEASLHYLDVVVDLRRCRHISWGSAVLACLYRSLSRAANTDSKEMSGPLHLLQCWIYERFRCFAPRTRTEVTILRPLGYRWHKKLSFKDTGSHALRVFRSQLTSLRDDQFNWTPYLEHLHLLPPTCRSGEQSWMCECFMIHWEVVEYHSPSRVMRQFGRFQRIPQNIPLSQDELKYLHNLNRTGKRGKNWEQLHSVYVASWRSRHQYSLLGEVCHGASVSPDYMNWYLSRTVVHITNPISNEAQQTGYHNDGGGLQYMMDGFSQVYQTTQQFYGQPHADPRLHDLHNTVSSIMDAGHQRHRLDLPTHLSQQPVELGEIPRRRMRRQRRIVDQNDSEFVTNQSFNLGDTMAGDTIQNNMGIYETGGASNQNQNNEHGGTSNVGGNVNMCYSPAFESPPVFHGVYDDFGCSPHHMTEFLTPTNFISQAQSQDFVFDPNFNIQSYEQRPNFSNVAPIPCTDLSLDLNCSPSAYGVINPITDTVFTQQDATPVRSQSRDNRGNRGLRRSSREPVIPDCGTGHPLHRNHP